MTNGFQLHLIIERKFGTKFIDFVNNYFPSNNHFFIVFSAEKYNLKNDSNVLFVTKKSLLKNVRTIQRLMNDSGKIHVHYLDNKEAMFLCLFCNRFLSKINWIIWGGDLYNDKGFPFSLFRKRIAKSCFSVSYLIKNDYLYFEKLFKTKKKCFKAQYFFGNELCDFILNNRPFRQRNVFVSVLVGNSATETNDHFDIFSTLNQLGKSFEVYCPLSYGDQKYADRVEMAGKESFKERFHPVRDFLKYSDYLSLISTIDVGVFGFRRQQGLGNLIPLLLMGKMVFLHENTPLYNELIIEYPEQVFSIENIKGFDFNNIECCAIDENKIRSYSNDRSIEIWRNIFDD